MNGKQKKVTFEDDCKEDEDSDYPDSFGPLLEALERENVGLFSPAEQALMTWNCADMTFKAEPEKDEASGAEKVIAIQEEDVCAQEEPKNSERDNLLKEETCDLKDILQTVSSDYLGMLGPVLKALEMVNIALILETEQLQDWEEDNLTFKKDESDNAEKVIQQEDVCVKEEAKISERDNVLEEDICDLEDMLQTEGSDLFGSFIKALGTVNVALMRQIEKLQDCIEDKLTFKKDESDRAEKVTVMQQEKIQEPDSFALKENDIGAQEELKTSVGGNLDGLDPKLQALESHNKALSNEVEQLKMCFARMTERYITEKREKEVLQEIIQELNIKHQRNMDLSLSQLMEASERENILRQVIDGLREALQKQQDEGSQLQAWEKERNAHLKELEDVKLYYEGKTLRVQDMFEKLKADKAEKDAIKEEQFKRIQELTNKVRQLQDVNSHEKLQASEGARMPSPKVDEPEETISCYEGGARPRTIGFSLNNEDVTEEETEQRKPKTRKGWKKAADTIKPWHWGKK